LRRQVCVIRIVTNLHRYSCFDRRCAQADDDRRLSCCCCELVSPLSKETDHERQRGGLLPRAAAMCAQIAFKHQGRNPMKARFTVALSMITGIAAAVLFEMLPSNYAWAIQVQKDDHETTPIPMHVNTATVLMPPSQFVVRRARLRPTLSANLRLGEGLLGRRPQADRRLRLAEYPVPVGPFVRPCRALSMMSETCPVYPRSLRTSALHDRRKGHKLS
jgi:hypothetical protein